MLSTLVGPFMKIAATFAKNILSPLDLTAEASVADAEIQEIFMVLEQH